MNTETSQPSDKPQWLKKLEEESWQAELIISGLAIYGSLQMPGLIEWLMDWCLANLNHTFFILVYFFFTYLGIGAYVLIFTFIGHFVLRAVWIGFVGLNSVFPKGVNEDSESYAKHFIQKFREDHSGQNEIIHQLDQMCSVFFGLAAQISMIFMAINLDILVLAIIWYIADAFLGPTVGIVISAVFFGTLILYTFLFFISNTKKFRDHPFVKKWQYPVYKRATNIMLNIFARPASYLAMVFQTNLSLKRYTGILAIVMLIVMVFFGARFANYRFISFMRPEMLYENFDRSDRLIPEQYASLRQSNRRLLSMELESEIVRGKSLRVFVPLLSGESSTRESICGEFVWDEKGEKRDKRRAFYNNCYQKTHRFYVNDRLYQNLNPVKYLHPNQGEEGILVYLSTAGFQVGKNVLKVEKSDTEEGSTLRSMQAVFWFEE